MTTPRRPGTDTSLGDHERRIRTIERLLLVDSRFFYVTPIAPATTTDLEYDAADPLYPAFQNGWGNLSVDYPPLAFRYLHGMLQITPAAITGGEGTPGSTVFTIPVGYPLPTRDARYFGSVGAAGEAIAVFELRTTGDFVFVNIVGVGSGSGVGGPGIFYDTDNVGDWLYVEATDQGGPHTSGLEFSSTGPGVIRLTTTLSGTDIQLNSAGGIQTTAVNDVLVESTAGVVKIKATDEFSGNVEISYGAGGLLRVFKGLTEVFQIDDSGIVHIKTGTTVQADL